MGVADTIRQRIVVELHVLIINGFGAFPPRPLPPPPPSQMNE